MKGRVLLEGGWGAETVSLLRVIKPKAMKNDMGGGGHIIGKMGRRHLWMAPNSQKLSIHLVTRLLYNDCYWYTLFHSNFITQRVKIVLQKY